MATKLVSPIRYNAAKPLEVRYDFASVGALLSGSYSYPEGALFNATEDSTSGGVTYPAGLYEYKKDENNELKWVKVNTDGLTEADKATLNQLKDFAICGKSKTYINRFGHVAFGDDEEPVALTLADFGITEGMTRAKAIEAGLIVDNELTQLPSGFNLLKYSQLKDWFPNTVDYGADEWYVSEGYLLNDVERKRIYIGDCTKVVFLSSTTIAGVGAKNRNKVLVRSFVVEMDEETGGVTITSPNWLFTETEGVGYMKMLSSTEMYSREEYYNVKTNSREFTLLKTRVEEVDTIDEHTKNTDIPSVGALKAYVEENGGSGSGGTTNYNNLTNKPLVNESDGSVSATGELKLKKGTADEVNVAAKLASLEQQSSNFVKSIKVGDTTYEPTNGLVTLPSGSGGSTTLYSERGQQTDGAPTNKLLDDNIKALEDDIYAIQGDINFTRGVTLDRYGAESTYEGGCVTEYIDFFEILGGYLPKKSVTFYYGYRIGELVQYDDNKSVIDFWGSYQGQEYRTFTNSKTNCRYIRFAFPEICIDSVKLLVDGVVVWRPTGIKTSRIASNEIKIGTLSELSTSNKSNLVSAINELYALIGQLTSASSTNE